MKLTLTLGRFSLRGMSISGVSKEAREAVSHLFHNSAMKAKFIINYLNKGVCGVKHSPFVLQSLLWFLSQLCQRGTPPITI